MKAAIVNKIGEVPFYGDFPEPSVNSDKVLVNIHATALSNFVRGKAAGKHYTSVPKAAFIPGVDGVGTLQNDQPVYFFAPIEPYGSMAEYTVTSFKNCVPLPKNINMIKAAALANPGMSSIAALRYRANIKPGQTVLINGATGVSGSLAVQIAKRLGAARVIATGRDEEALARLQKMGADICITLTDKIMKQEAAFIELLCNESIDIVLDYIWGPSMEAFFSAVAKVVHNDRSISVIQIGSMSAPTLSISASLLRSTALVLMGSGIGSISLTNLMVSIAEVFQMEIEKPLEINLEVVPLSEIETHWNCTTKARLVFTV